MHTAAANSLAMTAFLLEQGANVHTRNTSGQTPLFKVQNGCIALLIAKGAKVNEQDDEGNTPLHALDNIKTLLAYGGDCTVKNNKGKTALDVANENRNTCLSLGIPAEDLKDREEIITLLEDAQKTT